MATPSKVDLSVTDTPAAFSLSKLSEDSAKKASELLQANHDKHHIFFNQEGFHNHIAHHLLTLYALNAAPQTIQKQYDFNKSYQRPAGQLEEKAVESMHDLSKFKACAGNEKYYKDFLVFFQKEMEQKGWENVVKEYILKGDELADDMLVRLYAGFLHPIIHLGFGIEFHQPAIVAEALAQTAVHTDWMKPFFIGAENAAKKLDPKNSKSLAQLLDEIRADKELSTAPHWDDGNKVRDGILARAADKMIHYASQYSVREDELERKTAEMINAAVYFTGAAQRPHKAIKYDFYYMHCVNSSIFFTAFLQQDWLSSAQKIRLLEWKARADLALYASRRSPDLLIEEIEKYKPKQASSDAQDPWKTLFERVTEFEEDGHASKLVRALANGQRASKPYEERDEFKIKDKHWLQLGHMAVDSVQTGGPTWVRSAGFDEAWEQVPDRERAVL